METEITKQLTKVLAKESKVFAKKDSALKETWAKFSKMGIDTRSNYSFPLKDTIGRTFREQTQFQILKENTVAYKGYM